MTHRHRELKIADVLVYILLTCATGCTVPVDSRNPPFPNGVVVAAEGETFVRGIFATAAVPTVQQCASYAAL